MNWPHSHGGREIARPSVPLNPLEIDGASAAEEVLDHLEAIAGSRRFRRQTTEPRTSST